MLTLVDVELDTSP